MIRIVLYKIAKNDSQNNSLIYKYEKIVVQKAKQASVWTKKKQDYRNETELDWTFQ